jgi:hypothetical protein
MTVTCVCEIVQGLQSPFFPSREKLVDYVYQSWPFKQL